MLRLVKFNFVWASVANFRTLFLGALVACRSRHATAAKFLEETVETWMELKLVFFRSSQPELSRIRVWYSKDRWTLSAPFFRTLWTSQFEWEIVVKAVFFFFSMNVPFDHVHVSLAFVGILARRLGPAGISYWIVI